VFKLIKAGVLTAAILAGGVLADSVSVGVVDVKDVMQHSKRIQDESVKLKQKFGKENSAIDKMRKTLIADMNKMRKNSSVMAKKDRVKLQKEIMTREKALSTKQAAFSQAVMDAQKQIMKKVRLDFEKIAANLAKSKKLSLVLDQNGQVLYVASQNDLTSLVKKKFN